MKFVTDLLWFTLLTERGAEGLKRSDMINMLMNVYLLKRDTADYRFKILVSAGMFNFNKQSDMVTLTALGTQHLDAFHDTLKGKPLSVHLPIRSDDDKRRTRTKRK